MYIDYLSSPIGLIELKASDSGLSHCNFIDDELRIEAKPNPYTEQAQRQLSEYFAKTRQQFELTLDQQGTEFQHQVWQELLKIPYGQQASYQGIANALSNPKAVRAVGAANGKNPLAIIVPCHRVIGSNGTLTGYAGGLERKSWLLQHEGLMLL